MKYLGTYLGVGEASVELNLQKSMEKMTTLALQWCKHLLTLYARVLVFKAMILSKLTHVLSTCYIPLEKIDILQWMANDFLWRGKNKLKTKVMQNNFKQGGLNHINVRHYVFNLRAKWMTRLWKDNGTSWSFFAWKSITVVIPRVVIPGMTECAEHIISKIPFYAGVLKAFAYINHLDISVSKQ